MLALALAAALASTSPAAADFQTVSRVAPTTQTQVGDPDLPTNPGDITVDGRRLEEATQEFVREVASPVRGRGLARWRNGVCVGVVNLRTEMAQYIVDRVSTVAEDLGLRAGAPGCIPSIVIIATADATAFTTEFVAAEPRMFIFGAAGMDQGRAALRRFQNTERPVRWWTVSLPIEEDTGQVAVRMPGEVAPVIEIRGGGLLTTTVVNDTKRAIIILDVDQIGSANLTQLSDYLAMVALAQINPDADTSGFDTVLNLFGTGQAASGLTDWDMNYLEGLYSSVRARRNPSAARTEVASSMASANRRMTRQNSEDASPAE